MMSYFLQRSQCGSAPSGSTGSAPPIFTTRLSSALFPSGTMAQGRLGRSTRVSSSSLLFTSAWASRAADLDLSSATSCFALATSSVLPAFMSAPICEAFTFCCARRSSLSFWRLRLLLSSSRIFSTRGLASKFFTASLLITNSGSSRSNLSVNISCYCILE